MNKKKINSTSVFQFKVTLNDSSPRIWRRILVPGDYTFFELHSAIQDAMGWYDSHLHAFYITKPRGRDRIVIELPNPEMDDFHCPGGMRDERKEHIADYFGKTTKQCIYSYDFGDSWDHTILFERELPRDPKISYPQCVAGENACPPEDCGGVWGYADLQQTIKNPRHKEHVEMLDWLCVESPEEFNPNEFNPAEVEFRNPKERLAEWNSAPWMQ